MSGCLRECGSERDALDRQIGRKRERERERGIGTLLLTHHQIKYNYNGKAYELLNRM